MDKLLATHRPLAGISGRGAFAAVAAALMAWQHRHRARASLSRLDVHLLRDIGLSRGDVAEECSKPFWRD